MENYEEIITTEYDFLPVFDMEDEKEGYWTSFYPNETFYELLDISLKSLEPTSKDQDKKSIWVQGDYGTGKSHASSVVKHLLWDDGEKVEKFIDNLDQPYKGNLIKFRKDHRAFPVVIKGDAGISNNKTFSIRVQQAVMEELDQEGVSIQTETEFEKVIDFIKKSGDFIQWDEYIKRNGELSSYVKGKKDLLKKLKERDIDILEIVKDINSEENFQIVSTNLTNWLKEVSKEIREKDIADYLIIYWDEFTYILEQENVNNITSNQYQDLAELSIKHPVYLFLITHKFPGPESVEDRGKTLDRFNHIEYRMEPITTYNILENAIQKIDEKKWKEEKNKNLEENGEIIDLVKRLSEMDDIILQRSLENLFPIHPYTSYLFTFISRYLGSAERSIFTFLTNDEKGFLNFIKNNPGSNKNIFLNSDFLWDFFKPEFSSMDKNISLRVLQKFSNSKSKIEDKGEAHLEIFKSTLLLNVLQPFVKPSEEEISFVKPSRENIKSMYCGTNISEDVGEIIDFFTNEKILEETPDGNIEVPSGRLETKAVDKKKQSIMKNFGMDDIFAHSSKKDWEKIFTKNLTRSKVKIIFYDPAEKEYQIENQLRKDFNEINGELNLAIFLGHEKVKTKDIHKKIETFNNNDDFENIIFSLPGVRLDGEEFDNYIQYFARKEVASNKEKIDVMNNNKERAKKIIKKWMNRIEKGYINYYFRGDSKKCLTKDFHGKLNNEISKEIYPFGLDNTPCKKSTIWKECKSSKKGAEILLTTRRRKGLKNISGQFRYLEKIFKDKNGDWIIDTNLEIKSDADKQHPVIQAKNKIDDTIQNASNEKFNLGTELSFLSKPPYGYYKNRVHYGIMGFLLSDYLRNFYVSGSGDVIGEPQMRDVILSLFNFWEKGKEKENLNFRIGTEEEEKLINRLKEIFDLDDVKSLNNARWSIREKINKEGNPLWSYKKLTPNEDIKKTLSKIDELIEGQDKNIDPETIENLLSDIDNYKVDLESLIKKDSKEGFERWLKEEDAFNEVVKNEIESSDIKSYLEQSLQECVAEWNEMKVRNVLLTYNKNKMEELSNKKNEDRLLDSFEDLIEGEEDFDSLNDIKSELINNYCKSEYPFWIFKVYTEDVNIENTLMDIHEFICEDIEEFNSKKMDRLSDSIEPNKDGIKKVIANNPNEGFHTWMDQSKPLEDIDSKKIPEKKVKKYLTSELGSPPFEWAEEKVMNKLWSWRMGFENNDQENDITEERKSEIEKKIENFDGDVKKLLKKAINVNPDICDTLEDIIDGW